MLRRILVPCLSVLAILPCMAATWAQQPGPQADAIPVSGDAGPGLDVMDAAVRSIMRRHGIPGGAFAVAVKGRLVLARGYGYANLDTGALAQPDTIFGLASLSKPITALAILKLVEEGKLDLDARVLDLLRHIVPPRGARVDPRLAKVTVRHCLNHSGGWDRKISGDPANWSAQIARQLGVPQPVSPDQFIAFMLTVPLDFEPGTQSQYSNVGFVMLGQVVEKVSGERYEDYVAKAVLAPAKMRQARMSDPQRYYPGQARRYLAGQDILLPPLQLPMIKAAGGWTGSTIDMVRLLCALDGSHNGPLLKEAMAQQMFAPPPAPLGAKKDGTYPGLGFELVASAGDSFTYLQDGNYHGMRAFMKRSPRGINWALIFNASMQPDLIDRQIASAALQEVRDAVERIEADPNTDFFKE
jgi:N-acyl-D-amino-acid deacylase